MKNMDDSLFYEAKLKVKRANHHIQELACLLTEFFHRNPDRVEIEKETETTGQSLLVKVSGKDVEDIPLIIGDAIHNLHTALDYLVRELVVRAGKTPTKHTKFRIWESRQEAVAAIEGVIQGVSIDVISAFLEQVQPYVRGNDALCALHALDIADKHHLIIPIRTIIGIIYVVARDEGEAQHFAFGLTGEEQTRMVEMCPGPKIEGHRNPMLHIIFDRVEGFERQPVVPTLHHLREVVSAVVSDVEKAVLVSRAWFSL